MKTQFVKPEHSTVYPIAHQKQLFKKLFGLILSLILIVLSSEPGLAQESEKQEKDSLRYTIRPEFSLLSEYDNNIRLVNRESSDYQDDYVFHLMPKFGLLKPFKGHQYGLSLESDMRKGLQTVPFGMQLNTSGTIGLRFNNGFRLGLSDNFMTSDFDQGLTDFPGIFERKMNNLRSEAAWTTGRRFTIKGGYDNRWFNYKTEKNTFDRLSDIFSCGIAYAWSERFRAEGNFRQNGEQFKGQSDTTIHRTIREVDGQIALPLTQSFGAYVSFRHLDQFSEEMPLRDYTSARYAAGMTWKGQRRLLLWIEGGYAEVLYENPLSSDFFESVGEAGCTMQLSENINWSAAAGLDAWQNLTLKGDFNYKYSQKTLVNLLVNRKTETYFLSKNAKESYIASNYSLSLQTYLTEVIRMKVGGRYVTRDDYSDDNTIPGAGVINDHASFFLEYGFKPVDQWQMKFSGDYILQNSRSKTENNYQYNTWVGKIIADYSVTDHLKTGLHFLYASRNATKMEYDFDNTRVGIYATLIL